MQMIRQKSNYITKSTKNEIKGHALHTQTKKKSHYQT